jgi:hypothetical protein
MKKTIITLTLLLLACSLQMLSQEKVNLSYKMEKGKVYRYKSENSYTATQEMMGNEMKMTGDMRSILRFEVEDVGADGSISLITSKEESTVHSNMMGRDTTISMTKDIGKRTRLEIASNGTKKSTTPIDSTSDDASFMMGSSELQILADGPVSVGDKWTKTSTDTSHSEGNETVTTVVANYELAGKEMKNGHSCYRVNYKKTFEIAGKIRQMGMDMFMEGDGGSSGSFWFDDGKGLFVADESTMTQDITIAITGQTQMTIPSSQTINMKTYLIE